MQNQSISPPNFLDRYAPTTANIDFKKLLKVVWSRWYWVVGALLASLLGCFLFLKIANPRYVAEVSLRYSEKQSKFDELNKLIEPESFSSQDYLAEKYVIESEEVIYNAVKKLDYPFTFYAHHTFRREDVYPFQPFRAQVTFYDANDYGNGTFELSQKGIIRYTSEDEDETAQFDLAKDTLVSVKGLSFKINSVAQLSQDYTFTHNDLIAIKEAVDDRIDISEEERNLPIMNVAFTYENRKFAQDFLDKLIESYLEYNLGQKRLSSKLTVDFIQQQIKIYSDALRKASSQVESYKQRRAVPDLQSSMGEVMGRMSELKTQKSTLEIQRSYINLIEESLSTNRNEPINLGNIGLDSNTDPILVRLISDLNKVVLERKSLQLRGLSVNNPTVKAADEEIERVRQQILSNIKVQRQKNESTLEIVNQNLGMLDKRLNSLPSVERELIYLENDREVNQKIYLLLLDREIEASIVKAGILPSFNVLTRTPAYQIYPRPIRWLLIAIGLGLAVGFGAIFLMRFANNKFTEIGKIGQHEHTQLLGIIQRYPDRVQNSEKDLLQFLEHRSLFAESVNGLRTNLNFFLSQNPTDTGKLLVITSEISGEGKSFITVNLGISLTKIGKRVLIVVSDLRRSKLHHFFNNNNKVGLSTYLSKKVTDYHKIINHSVVEGLDYVTAGPVPFNPSELIQHERFEQLIAQCRREYDYVLVDTAPVGLVSDNIPLLQKSDLVLFIVRWRYSNKESYLLAEQMADEYGVKAVGVIVNDFYKDDLYSDLNPGAYYGSRGYGYYYKYTQNYYQHPNGYHHEQDVEQNAWQKLKQNFKRRLTQRRS